MVNYHDDPRCLQCGHRPPTFTANPKPVLADLRCTTCLRDRERGSEWCRQCGVKQRKNEPRAPKFRKTHCVNGHKYTPANTRLKRVKGYWERKCLACERARQKGKVTR